jgi:hypothetical protein
MADESGGPSFADRLKALEEASRKAQSGSPAQDSATSSPTKDASSESDVVQGADGDELSQSASGGRSDLIAALERRVTALEDRLSKQELASKQSSGGGADGDGSPSEGSALTDSLKGLETLTKDHQARIASLESGLAKAQASADSAKRLATEASLGGSSGGGGARPSSRGSERSRGGGRPSSRGSAADDDGRLRDAVKLMGEDTQDQADDDHSVGLAAGESGVSNLRRTPSNLQHASRRSPSPGVLGDRRSPSARSIDSPSAAQGVSEDRVAVLETQLPTLLGAIEELRKQVRDLEQEVARRKPAGDAAPSSTSTAAPATAAPATTSPSTSTDLSDKVDQLAEDQARLSSSVDSIMAMIRQTQETADAALSAARLAQRNSTAQGLSNSSDEGGALEGGGSTAEQGGAGDAAAMQEMVISVIASTIGALGTLAGFGRCCAGLAGVPSEKLESLAGEAEGAIDELKLVHSALTQDDEAPERVPVPTASEAGRAVTSAANQASKAMELLVEEALSLSQTKANQSDLGNMKKHMGLLEGEIAKAHASVREAKKSTEEQLAMVITGAVASGEAMSSAAGSRGVDGEEMAELWDALATKAGLDELNAYATHESLTAKADRRDVSRLRSLLDKLWRHVEAMGAGGGKKDGDWAFLSGKPLQDYKCLSCGHQLDNLVEPPPFHVPTGVMTMSVARGRRSPGASRGGSPQPQQSLVLPNGTVINGRNATTPSTPVRKPAATVSMTSLPDGHVVHGAMRRSTPLRKRSSKQSESVSFDDDGKLPPL